MEVAILRGVAAQPPRPPCTIEGGLKQAAERRFEGAGAPGARPPRRLRVGSPGR